MSTQKKKPYKFSYDELSGICFQITLMLHSGILLYEGVSIMCNVRDQSTERQRILRGIAEELEQNTYLCTAMQKCGAFPQYMIGMVELGKAPASSKKLCQPFRSTINVKSECAD